MSTDTNDLFNENTFDNLRNPIWWISTEFAKPHLPYISLGLGLRLIARLCWLYPTVVFGQVLNSVIDPNSSLSLLFVPQSLIPAGPRAQIWFAAGVIAVAFFVGSVLTALGSWAQALAAYRIQHELRVATYEKAQSHPISFFENEHSGKLMSIMNNDINQLYNFFSNTLKIFGNATFILLGVSFYMLLLNWQLALVTFVSPIIIFLLNYLYNNYIKFEHKKLRENISDINTTLSNNMNGISVIKVYNNEEREKERIKDASREYRKSSWVVDKLQILMDQITGRITDIGDLLVFIVGGIWVVSGPPLFFTQPLEGGTLVIFFFLVGKFNWPLHQVPRVVDEFQEASAASERVYGIYKTPEIVTKSEPEEKLSDIRGSVTYSNVNFSYNDNDTPTLRDISFKVDAGDTIGIVGPTGAGKSTLIKLLPKFYAPNFGTIQIDQMNIKNVDEQSVRQHIAYVSQEPYLFEGSIGDNIGYGDPNNNIQDVKQAAQLSAAHEFITEMDEGYSTKLGEKGESLSGGQRQRISLARAFYHNPEIIILDEATSHVDNITELKIHENVQDHLEDSTVFIIAHRISNVRDSDRIFVMEDGAIVERGTHQKLVEQEGLYAALWGIQVGEYSKIKSQYYQRLSEYDQLPV
jgi:ATP-binding cassette subfamily B protein